MKSAEPIFRKVIDPNSTSIRQALIKKIQRKLNTKLIVYTANPNHPLPMIILHDALLFEDVLRSVAGTNKGCLMINSPGGDANAAEKLLIMCRERFTEEFDVIVPDYAKSAATMVALGSDKIMMGYLAELGPIDPQLQTSQIPGGGVIPARSFIDGLDMIRDRVKRDGDPVQMYIPMLNKIQPEVVAICQRAIDDAKNFAEKWLKRYMLRDDPKKAEDVAEMLSTGAAYKSHGKVIDFSEAKNVLGLNVEKIDKDSDLWSDVWELYCRSITYLQQSGIAAKLFESESVSLTLNVSIGVIKAPTKVPPTQTPKQLLPSPEKPPQS